MLNKPSGNMYNWAYTWNPIGGYCPHQCEYCYVKGKLVPRGLKKYDKKPYLADVKTKLDIPGEYILFVCSCFDIMAKDVPRSWILRILEHCNKYPETTFLFQSKNPYRFNRYIDKLPPKTILGTTLESNHFLYNTKAPSVKDRYIAFAFVKYPRKMVSIEPLMDFDLFEFVEWLENLELEFVSIGADSGNNNLLEPSATKTKRLIDELKKFTEIRIKKNLDRIVGKGYLNWVFK